MKAKIEFYSNPLEYQLEWVIHYRCYEMDEAFFRSYDTDQCIFSNYEEAFKEFERLKNSPDVSWIELVERQTCKLKEAQDKEEYELQTEARKVKKRLGL